jgi:hypothetical protein
MLRQYKKFAFSIIALFAISTSMFKLSIDDVLLSSLPGHKPFHSSETVFTSVHDSSVLLALEEIDSEEAVDGEDADDEVEDICLEFDLFTDFNFASFQSALVTPSPDWDESSVKGYKAPLYLVNRNFRI